MNVVAAGPRAQPGGVVDGLGGAEQPSGRAGGPALLQTRSGPHPRQELGPVGREARGTPRIQADRRAAGEAGVGHEPVGAVHLDDEDEQHDHRGDERRAVSIAPCVGSLRP